MNKTTVAKKLDNGDVVMIDVQTGTVVEAIGRGLLENDAATRARVEEHTYDYTVLHKNIQQQLSDARMLLKKMPIDAEVKNALIEIEVAERSVRKLFKGYGVQA